MPEATAPLALARYCMGEVRDKAVQLVRQSRFLRLRSDGLRGKSNDLLTVARFRVRPVPLARQTPHRHLVLVV